MQCRSRAHRNRHACIYTNRGACAELHSVACGALHSRLLAPFKRSHLRLQTSLFACPPRNVAWLHPALAPCGNQPHTISNTAAGASPEPAPAPTVVKCTIPNSDVNNWSLKSLIQELPSIEACAEHCADISSCTYAAYKGGKCYPHRARGDERLSTANSVIVVPQGSAYNCPGSFLLLSLLQRSRVWCCLFARTGPTASA